MDNDFEPSIWIKWNNLPIENQKEKNKKEKV